MIKKYAARYRHWQQHVQLTTPFVIVCGLVATIYFFYRILLVLFPAISLEQAAFHLGGKAVVCSNDDSRLQDPAPILSAAYQRRIMSQKHLGPNLVTNPNIAATDPETGQPSGYTQTTESGASYSYIRRGKEHFLRVATTNKTPQGGVAPSWQMDQVPVQENKAYGYSFWYRSTIPVQVSIEYVTKKGIAYENVTTLSAASSWQQFAAHFNNDKDAKKFRVTLTTSQPGQLDTRTFDIHEIPDARLDKGIVTVAFDDGWQSVNDKALPLLDRYGVRTTQYVIAGVAGTTPEYMNFAVLLNLKKHGHEIGSHTLDHCDQTRLKTQDVQNNAIKSKQTLESQELGPIKSFAYPLGQYNAKTQAIYEKGYPLVRSSDFGYNDRYFDTSNIRSIAILSTTSNNEVSTWLDYARTHRVWLVLAYHRVDASGKYSITSWQLERQLKLIKDSSLEILPLSEAATNIQGD